MKHTFIPRWPQVSRLPAIALASVFALAGFAVTAITAPPAEGTPKPAAMALPPVTPLFDSPVRDTSVCAGPDKTYYLTGTTGHPTWWKTNEGIRIWKSKDLKMWEPLGLVWSFEKDATWQKVMGDKRAIWAPELHYFKDTFWIAYCVNYGGTGILRSKSGKVEGPYEENILINKPTEVQQQRSGPAGQGHRHD